MKRYLILALVLLIIFPMVSSIEESDCWKTPKKNTEIQLIQKCPSCSFVNLTSISYPNGTDILNLNEEMTKTGVNFNYTLPDSSQIGFVSYGVIGDKDGANPPEEQTLCVFINPTGAVLQKPESSFYFVMLFVILILFSLFLVIGIKMPFENRKEQTRDGMAITKVTYSKYVKLVSLWISYGFFVWFMTIISSMANNYIFFEGVKNMMSNLSLYINILGWGINVAMVSLLIWLTWKDIILNKTIIKNGKALLNEL